MMMLNFTGLSASIFGTRATGEVMSLNSLLGSGGPPSRASLTDAASPSGHAPQPPMPLPLIAPHYFGEDGDNSGVFQGVGLRMTFGAAESREPSATAKAASGAAAGPKKKARGAAKAKVD